MADGGDASAATAKTEGTYRTAQIEVTLLFDKTNQAAVDVARAHTLQLSGNISRETRRGIQALITTGFEKGVTVQSTSRLIRGSIGLTEKGSKALVNANRRLTTAKPGSIVKLGRKRYRIPKGGLSAAKVDSFTAKYSSKLLNDRAKLIARTETIRASNEGQRQLWLQAQEQGLLTGTELREWIITPDDRLCEECEAMEGELAALNESFVNPATGEEVMGPPLHPDCRCAVGLTTKTIAKDEGVDLKSEPLPEVKTKLSPTGFNPTSYRDIGSLTDGLATEFGAAEGVGFEFSSSAANTVGARGYYDPRLRRVFFSTDTSEGLVSFMQGATDAKSWNSIRTVAHELEHSKSKVLRAMGSDSAIADWAIYWEEGIVEIRARANATKLMFGKGKSPVFTGTGSYGDNVNNLKFLMKNGLNAEEFFAADSFERLKLVNGIAKRKAAEVLGVQGFSEVEIASLIEKLGDDLQHLIRLNKLTPARWGSMTKRQILADLRNNFDIQLSAIIKKPSIVKDVATVSAKDNVLNNVSIGQGVTKKKAERVLAHIAELPEQFVKQVFPVEGGGVSLRIQTGQISSNLGTSPAALFRRELVAGGEQRSIILREVKKGRTLEELLRHEMGHAFDATGNFSGQIKSEWLKDVAKFGKNAGDRFVKHYALNEREAFAQSTNYLLGKRITDAPEFRRAFKNSIAATKKVLNEAGIETLK